MNNVMKHGSFGSWGDVVFKTLATPTSISDSRKFRVSPQSVIDGYPQHQISGEDERVISLSITLHNEFSDLAKVSQTLLAQSKPTASTMPFVLGNEIIAQDMRCRSIVKTLDEMTPQGVLIAVTYQLTLVDVR
ncbi:phage tail protein [Shewanella halifaxensis]|uniref:phage tail protein n=1 Tax=Shewanella halifaxensis TaxID=271098 RepID=UPI000D594DD9|nr:phage tail protein [Shewanella halifaxensis]